MPKHGIGFAVGIALSLLTIAVQHAKIESLYITNQELTMEYDQLDQTLRDEQIRFKNTVKLLEDELSKYALAKDSYECSVASKSEAIDNTAKEEESKIKEELKSDSSSDNQLTIARRILHEFSSKNK